MINDYRSRAKIEAVKNTAFAECDKFFYSLYMCCLYKVFFFLIEKLLLFLAYIFAEI